KSASDELPIPPPWALSFMNNGENFKFFQTSKVVQTEGDEGNNSTIFVGGFPSLNLGVRLQAEIILTPVSASTYGYDMLAVFRGDWQCERVTDLCLIEEVSPATLT